MAILIKVRGSVSFDTNVPVVPRVGEFIVRTVDDVPTDFKVVEVVWDLDKGGMTATVWVKKGESK